MREIKFRAWDEYNKCLHYDYVWFEQREGYIAENVQKPVRCRITEVMQFTGRLDKNGKEIYEGDVVENPLLHGKRWVVTYRTDTEYVGYLLCEVGKNDDRLSLFVRWCDLEIIGNIYENPELIKASV